MMRCAECHRSLLKPAYVHPSGWVLWALDLLNAIPVVFPLNDEPALLGYAQLAIETGAST